MLQALELELTGQRSMSMRDYYRITLVQSGFAPCEVDHALKASATDDYHALVAMLHATEPAEAMAESCASTPAVLPPLYEHANAGHSTPMRLSGSPVPW